MIEGNLVVDNDQAGIVHELGYSPVIRNNTVEGNGFASDGLGGEGAGILAFSVRDAEIHGNVVTGNRNGIAGRSDDRGVDSDTGEEWLLEDLYVHDNLITMDEGATGIWDYLPGEPALEPEADIRFEGNIYTLTPSSGRFLRWTDAIAGNGSLGPRSPSPAGGRTSHWTATTSAMARYRPSSAPPGPTSSSGRRGRT